MLQNMMPLRGDRLVIVAEINGHGLTRDAEILRDLLTPLGWQVDIVHPRNRPTYRRYFHRQDYDVALHLETYHPNWTNVARLQYLIPNPEWFKPKRLRWLKHIDQVLAKTEQAVELFEPYVSDITRVGFTSEDRYDPMVQKDWNSFFHLAGASFLKGTETILSLWEKHPEWPELLLIQREENAPDYLPQNVRLISRHLPDEDLKILQNRAGIHLCPSRSEGWGHYLIEAMSVGAVVVTTNAPPMNEFVTSDSGILVPFDHTEPRKMAQNYFVSESELERQIERLLVMPDTEKMEMGVRAQEQYRWLDAGFRNRLPRLLQPSIMANVA